MEENSVNVMLGRPEGSEEGDDLDYVWELREMLEDAYEVAREHLKPSADRQKRYYDVKANEQPYKVGQ